MSLSGPFSATHEDVSAKIKAFARRAAVLAAVVFPPACAAANAAPAPFELQNSAFSDLRGGSRAEFPAVPDVKAPAVSTAAPDSGNNEQLHFWEQLKNDVFDNVCKQAQIDLNKGASIDNIAGIDGSFKRYLRQYPDSRIGLIDEVGVRLDGGHTFADILNTGVAPLHFGFSASLEGKSVVARKLGETRHCKTLVDIADIRKVKTILPINEARISGMKPGEIWKLPAAFKMGISGGAGMPIQPWAAISFSLGASKEMKPSITLYKVSEDAMRLRVRLDNVTVLRAGASAGTSFSAGMIGLPEAEFFLVKALEDTVAREINNYLALRFGLSAGRSKGRKILLEFMLDPKNPDHTARLVDFMKGDLGIIRKLIDLGVRFSDFSGEDDPAEGADELGEVEHAASDTLGMDASFAGSDHYNGSSHGFNAVLPLVAGYESDSGRRYDRYQTLDGDDVLHVHNVFKKSSASNLNIPVLGKVFKHDVNQNFYVVNHEGRDGAVSDAAVVYQRYEGYVHHNEKDARKMVGNMNDILKYAGTEGEGTNSEFAVDTDSIFPRLAAIEDGEGGRAKRYNAAMMSFSLAFSKEAVADIITAPAAVIMKAAMNLLEGAEREIVSKVLPLVGADGSYEKDSVRELLAPYERTGFDALGIVHDFVRDAAELVTDLAGLAMIGGQKARADRLSRVLAGKGESRLGYDKLMRVLIQLVDVKDIYANLTVKTDKRIKNEANINNTYTLYNEDLEDGQNLNTATANDMRDRFADPSTLSD